MVFNTTFNNISVITWQSVLLVEETGVPGENHCPVARHWQTLSHNVVLSTLRLSRVRTLLHSKFKQFYYRRLLISSHKRKTTTSKFSSIHYFCLIWRCMNENTPSNQNCKTSTNFIGVLSIQITWFYLYDVTFNFVIKFHVKYNWCLKP